MIQFHLEQMVISTRWPAVPDRPGVYIFKDSSGRVIYVGKASNLKNRVRSYCGRGPAIPPRVSQMVSHIHDLEVIIADSEQDALLLECNLIKRYRPHYNIRLKDDKSFPYIRIDLDSEWPRLCLTRRVEKGGRYFGPYASAASVRHTLSLLQRLFPLRSCSRMPSGNPRACLDYHISRCLGPCIGAVTREEYSRLVRQVLLFLEGRQEQVVRDLRRQMTSAADRLEFEKAGQFRNQIAAIEQVIEGQKLAATVKGDQDVIAFVRDSDLAFVQVFFIRNGKLTGRDHFLMEGVRDAETQEIASSFIKQFYSSSTSLPPVLLLQYKLGDTTEIEDWLSSRRGGRVRLWAPQRGEKRRLVERVEYNARQGMDLFRQKHVTSPQALASALAELRDRLHLARVPARIECYDISNIMGTAAVGSMVVFEHGLPKPAHYRRFRITGVAHADDYAMLQEVLRRRFKRAETTPDREHREAIWTSPDLVIVDGGKGQLHAAEAVVHDLKLDIPIISIAKEWEQIFTPGRSEPVDLPPTTPASQMIQRIRDEAHRFAINYHTRLRSQASMASALDRIAGIGPKRKQALLRRFGYLEGIRQASTDAIAKAAGISPELAQTVKESL